GGHTRFEIGEFDLPTTHTGPDGSWLGFGYDTELRLTAVTNSGHNVLRPSHRITRAGWRLRRRDPAGLDRDSRTDPASSCRTSTPARCRRLVPSHQQPD